MDINEQQKQRQEKMKQSIEKITQHAAELYELMELGEVIEITFSEMSAIVVPNKLPKMKRLIIIKPYIHFQIQFTLK